MRSPIKDKFSKETIDLMKEFIKNTRNTGIEHGFIMCSNNVITPSKERAVGIEHEVGLQYEGACKDKIQGNFHTHPRIKYLRKSYESSELRDLLTIEEFEELSVIKDDPIPSIGDLSIAAVTKGLKTTDGTTCIGNDVGSDKISCWTAKDMMPKELIRTFVDIFKNRDKRMNDAPTKEMRRYFDIENIKLQTNKI